jgi:very-short-patch-repair endonuclease
MQSRISLPPALEHRPFSRSEALRLGVSDGRLRGSDLVRPFHGVRTATSVATLEAQCRAFLVRMPAAGFFNSVTAAAIMGLPLPRSLPVGRGLHVAVPAPSRGLRAAGVIGHKVQLMGDDVRLWHGLPVSSPERTYCEIAAVVQLADLVAVGDHLIHWRSPLCTLAALDAAALRYPGQRGRARLFASLALLDDRAESPQESRLRVLLVGAGISGFRCNYELRVRGRLYRIDLAFAELKIAIEYQGDHHRSPEQWRRDMTRRSILAADGWFVIELNADDLNDPAELVARIRQVLATRRRDTNRSS